MILLDADSALSHRNGKWLENTEVKRELDAFFGGVLPVCITAATRRTLHTNFLTCPVVKRLKFDLAPGDALHVFYGRYWRMFNSDEKSRKKFGYAEIAKNNAQGVAFKPIVRAASNMRRFLLLTNKAKSADDVFRESARVREVYAQVGAGGVAVSLHAIVTDIMKKMG
jgi:hypothetical protein